MKYFYMISAFLFIGVSVQQFFAGELAHGTFFVMGANYFLHEYLREVGHYNKRHDG